MKIFNRQAKHEYELAEKVEAGLVLTGPEVKSVSEGKISLEGSFARIKNGEIWLYNCHIHPYRFAEVEKIDPRRPRKLLLHKKEILALTSKIQQKRLTLVPLSCYTRGRHVKLELALGRGKKAFEKRQAEKKKDLEKDLEQDLLGDE